MKIRKLNRRFSGRYKVSETLKDWGNNEETK